MKCTLAAVSDFAYFDRASGKQFILGVIRYIWARSVPALHPRLAVTFALEEFTRELVSPVVVRLHLHDADGMDVLPPSPEITLPFSPIGPAAYGQSICQITLELNNVQLNTFGDYAVVLMRNTGTVLARAAFSVQPTPQNPSGDE
jgi:hypothetical protein